MCTVYTRQMFITSGDEPEVIYFGCGVALWYSVGLNCKINYHGAVSWENPGMYTESRADGGIVLGEVMAWRKLMSFGSDIAI